MACEEKSYSNKELANTAILHRRPENTDVSLEDVQFEVDPYKPITNSYQMPIYTLLVRTR